MTARPQALALLALALLTICAPAQELSETEAARLAKQISDHLNAQHSVGKFSGSALVADQVQISQYPVAPLEDRNGKFWFGTAFKGLVRYDGKDYVYFTSKDGLGGNTVRDVLEDKDGLLWLATSGGLSLYDGESFTTLSQYESMKVTYAFGNKGNHLDLWDVLKDRQGRLWIATMDGVFRLDGKSFSRFVLPKPAAQHPYEFTPRMVYCIFEDKAGDLWFGTDGAGIVRYDGKTKVVYTMKDNGLCSDRICSIVQDKRGMFWFGTSDGGVSRYDGTSFQTFLQSKTVSKHMGRGRVMGILEDNAGLIWFGVAGPGRGVYRYDGETFQRFSKTEGLGEVHVASLSEDRSGRLWIGTSNGAYRLNGKRFVNVTRKAAPKEATVTNDERS